MGLCWQQAQAHTHRRTRSLTQESRLRMGPGIYAQLHTHGDTCRGPRTRMRKRVCSHGEPVCCVSPVWA